MKHLPLKIGKEPVQTKHRLLYKKVDELIDFLEYFIEGVDYCNGKCFIATRSGDNPIQVTKYCSSGQHSRTDGKYPRCKCTPHNHIEDDEDIYCEQCAPKECCKHPECHQTLAQKFQDFRSKSISGKGIKYWKGLEMIAMKHFEEIEIGA